MAAELSGEATDGSIRRCSRSLPLHTTVKRTRRWPRGWAREGQPHRGQWFTSSSHLVGGKPPLLSKEQEQWTQGAGPCCGRAACGRDGCGADAARPPGTSPPQERLPVRELRALSHLPAVQVQPRGLQARSISVPLCQGRAVGAIEGRRSREKAGRPVDVRCVTGTASSLGAGLVLLPAGAEKSSPRGQLSRSSRAGSPDGAERQP